MVSNSYFLNLFRIFFVKVIFSVFLNTRTILCGAKMGHHIDPQLLHCVCGPKSVDSRGVTMGDKGATILRAPNYYGGTKSLRGRRMTARSAEKSQQCHKYFLQYSTFASEGFPQVRTRGGGRQTCFLPRAPSYFVTPLVEKIHAPYFIGVYQQFFNENKSLMPLSFFLLRCCRSFNCVKNTCK